MAHYRQTAQAQRGDKVDMDIHIQGSSIEIAALVLELQRRQDEASDRDVTDRVTRLLQDQRDRVQQAFAL